MLRMKLVFLMLNFYLIILICFSSVTCNGKKMNHHCDSSILQDLHPSGCREKLNIRHPFRLEDDPTNCGDLMYQLTCESNRTTVLDLESGKYFVQAINYKKHRIRVVDAGVQMDNCSSLQHLSLLSYHISNLTEPYYLLSTEMTILVSCESPVINSPQYIEIDMAASCNMTNTSSIKSKSKNKSSRGPPYAYLLFDDPIASEIKDNCTVEMLIPLSKQSFYEKGENVSFRDIYNELLYGFELSWDPSFNGVGIWKRLLYIAEDICFAPLVAFKLYWYPSYGLSELPVRDVLILSVVSVLELILVGRYIIGIVCLFAYLIYKWRRRHLSVYDGVEEFLQSQNNLMPIRYSYSDLKRMTKNFNEKLGEGGFGSVYKGKLRSGRLVAVKMLTNSKANGQDFINEVSTLGRIRHVHVVHLVGFCVSSNSKRALVYDFMPNGSLDKYIFSNGQRGMSMISWKRTYEIALGVARGIEYLHRGCDVQILHFDIKPHNILLDDKFVPKVSDFGLAKLYPVENSFVTLTAARGTLGYIAPELIYKKIGGVSYKADVYSFGMLLMEMAGRRKNLNPHVEHTSQIYFPSWIDEQLHEGEDVDFGQDTTEEEKTIARKIILVGLWCIQMIPGDRPSMRKVVEMLEGEVGVLELPPKILLYPQNSPARDGIDNRTTGDSTSTAFSLSTDHYVALEIEQLN